jgi:hypothetical protein
LHSVYMCTHPSVAFPSPSRLSDPSLDSPSFTFIIIIIVVNIMLGSTNEWEHVIFGLLSLTCDTQHDDLQVHPFSCKWHNLRFCYGCNIPLYVYFMYIYFLLFTHWLLDTLTVSTVWLLWRKLRLHMSVQVSLLYIGLRSFRCAQELYGGVLRWVYF